MTKRESSLALQPSRKKARLAFNSSVPTSVPSSKVFPTIEEVVFQIFSHLDAFDLCAIQPVSKFWSRLASDNQLWKALFYAKHPLLRLRGGRGSYPRPPSDDSDGHEGLGSSLNRSQGAQRHRHDWKWMYRVAWNWERGRCSKTRLSGIPTLKSGEGFPNVTLAGHLTIASLGHRIAIHSPASPRVAEIVPALTTSHITALAVDQSASSSSGTVRLAVFHCSGYFAIYSFSSTLTPFAATELYRRYSDFMDQTMSEVIITDPRIRDVVCASYHHPILITLSSAFHLSIYYLPTNDRPASGRLPAPRLHRTLHSFTSFPPSSMSLTRAAPGVFKLLLTYTMPVYPSHWTAGVTELTLSIDELAGGRAAIDVPASRTASALRRGWNPSFGIPQNSQSISSPNSSLSSSSESSQSIVQFYASQMQEWNRKIGHVVGTQTDGKWVVIAGHDNILQVYRLYRPPPPSPLELRFVRSLFGHTAGISTLQVSDGRCISVGCEGRMRIWDLEGGWGVEIGQNSLPDSLTSHVEAHEVLAMMNVGESSSTPRHDTFSSPSNLRTPKSLFLSDKEDQDPEAVSSEYEHSSDEAPYQAVAFDERRIVTYHEVDAITIWNFDV